MIRSISDRLVQLGLSLGSIVVLAAAARADILSFGVCSDGAQAGTGSSGSGFATVVVDTATGAISISGSYTGLTGTQSLAHIHGPALIGTSAGPVIALSGSGGMSGAITGAGTLTSTEMTDLLSGLHYINIHTTAHPGGEIRGQIVQRTNLVFPAQLATDPALFDISGNALIGPKIGSVVDAFDVALDCTGAMAGGLYAFRVTLMTLAVPLSTALGDIWVAGPALLGVFGLHSVSIETIGAIVLPLDVNIVGVPFPIQGFCGDSTPGQKGRMSNALTQWIGL